MRGFLGRWHLGNWLLNGRHGRRDFLARSFRLGNRFSFLLFLASFAAFGSRSSSVCATTTPMHEANTKPAEPQASSPSSPETGPNCFTCMFVATPAMKTTIPAPATMQSATWIFESTAETSAGEEDQDSGTNELRRLRNGPAAQTSSIFRVTGRSSAGFQRISSAQTSSSRNSAHPAKIRPTPKAASTAQDWATIVRFGPAGLARSCR